MGKFGVPARTPQNGASPQTKGRGKARDTRRICGSSVSIAEASLAGPTERVDALMRSQGAQERETWGWWECSPANTGAREHPLPIPPRSRRRAMARQLVWQYEKCALSGCAHLRARGMRRARSGAVRNFSTAQTKLWQELHKHDKRSYDRSYA